MSVSWGTDPIRDFTYARLEERTREVLALLLGLPHEQVVLRSIEDAWAPSRYTTPSEVPAVEVDATIGPRGGSYDLAFMLMPASADDHIATVSIGTYPGHLFVGESKSDSGRALALATVLAAAQLGGGSFLEANDLWPWEDEGPYEASPDSIIERLRLPLRPRSIAEAATQLFVGTKVRDPVPTDYVHPATPERYLVIRAPRRRQN